MLPQRTLGPNGPQVGALGYGAMVLEGYYGRADEAAGIHVIQHALDLGMTMLDTADAYGNGHNESLIAKAIHGQRDDAFIATKFGIVFEPGEPATPLATGWNLAIPLNATPAYARRALERSLQRLGVDTIDLWYLHYPDPSMPIEETVGVMAEAVRAGKVRYLGLSNVTAEQVRKAHAVHPIAAVQFEYSLWRREAENELLPCLRQLGIALVPWAPLGSGFLTGTVTEITSDDFRQHNPKLTGGNLQANLDRFAPLQQLAASLDLTPAQLALAWLIHQGADIVPIPGTRQAARLDENALAAFATLDQATLQQIDALAPVGSALGGTLVA
ncbi:MAG: aldo/keto reductase [Candidatus Competibacteraceae bacterium]|nr:MAG: aldo/keto reductase [Candidatus Competibacteraceae bacterium]